MSNDEVTVTPEVRAALDAAAIPSSGMTLRPLVSAPKKGGTMPVEMSRAHGNDVSAAINDRAPVVGTSEIEIAAAAEAVWEVLTAFAGWPSWNPDVRSIDVQGPVAPGSVFRWKAGPGTITSTIQRVERPSQIAWTGRTLGIKAVHVWRLEPRGATTLVRTEESFEGLLARLLRGSLQKTLDNSLADGLRYLKAEVERRAAPAATTSTSRSGEGGAA